MLSQKTSFSQHVSFYIRSRITRRWGPMMGDWGGVIWWRWKWKWHGRWLLRAQAFIFSLERGVFLLQFTVKVDDCQSKWDKSLYVLNDSFDLHNTESSFQFPPCGWSLKLPAAEQGFLVSYLWVRRSSLRLRSDSIAQSVGVHPP